MKKTYEVAEGIKIINGQKVPANRRVSLTDAEALYDLALGRLSEVAPKGASAGKQKPTSPFEISADD